MIWSSKHTVRIFAKGGILTPSHLLKILEVVKSTGYKYVHFGSRQDLLFQVKKKHLFGVSDVFGKIQTDFVIHGRKGSKVQNIVSSYVSADITVATSWLKSGNYLNILENFTYLHKLRINITDPKQSLIPLFYGHLNFIASPVKDYWYLFIRRTYTSPAECWPVMVLSNDIANLSEAVENNWLMLENGSISNMFEHIQAELDYNWHMLDSAFKVESQFPIDYEGFGRMHNSQNFWAGFYWRNNNYDIDFLEEVCHLCLKSNISKICLTSWKSILIKEIKESDLLSWQRLLGRFGINMRHSSFELNWHLPFKDKNAYALKRFLVKEFDKVDISVHGLTFGIKNKPEPSFCAIQIERTHVLPFLKSWDFLGSYKVLFANKFNANTCEYEEYASQVPRYRLPEVLQFLTRKYYAQLLKNSEYLQKVTKPEKVDKHLVYQCIHCLTVYDDKLESTPFIQLPDTYLCPLCDAPKADYKPIYLVQLLKNALI